ncbi:MAG: hypothetical protein ACXVAX_05855 [Pseudobdellovibrio sp.]
MKYNKVSCLVLSALMIGALAQASDVPAVQSKEYRESSLVKAKIFAGEPTVGADLSVSDSDPGSFKFDDVVECDWDFLQPPTATTPKFHCKLRGTPDGKEDSVKVKYTPDGGIDPYGEVFTTVLSARLFKALGFQTNRYFLVKKLRCYGCSSDPYSDAKRLAGPDRDDFIVDHFKKLGPAADGDGFRYQPDYSKYTEFTYVSILRKEGTELQASDNQGLSFNELSKIDSSQQDNVDAFRLLASFIFHSDNHSPNQALVCLDKKKDIVDEMGSDLGKSSSCQNPAITIKDAGITFGKGWGLFSGYRSLDLNEWKKDRIWKNDDPTDCTVVLDGGSPFNTFHTVTIKEAGRAEFARRINTLTTEQITQLFNGIDIANLPFKGHADYNDVNNWVKAFQDKVQSINSKHCSQ